jgi:dihydroorotate dehydrogenase (NAD+) catalytic subunit
MADLTQRLFGTDFQSPVLLASGTCGYGEEYAELIPLERIGGLVTKAVSLEPRSGNPPHRVAETPGGMINAIGLQNVGLERFRREKLPWLRSNLDKARVLINVVGHSAEDFGAVVSGLDGDDGYLGFEINVSCPNVEGGTLFGTDKIALADLVGRLRALTERPLVVKLTPNVPDIEAYARICEERGGIRSRDDAIQYILAGASLVQIGTALFVDPAVATEVHDGIGDYLDSHGFDRLTDLVGAVEIPESA